MIAQVEPSEASRSESTVTLDFAQRMKKVRLGAKKNRFVAE